MLPLAFLLNNHLVKELAMCPQVKIQWPRFKPPNCHLISLYPVPPVNKMALNAVDQPAETLSTRTWVEFRLNLSESSCGTHISLDVCRIWPWVSESHLPRQKQHFAPTSCSNL